MQNWKDLKTKEVYKNQLFSVTHSEVLLPDGRTAPDFIRIHSGDWVIAPVITKEGELLGIKQYRHGIQEIEMGLVAGVINKDEAHKEAVKRECLEETGYGGGTWTYLGCSDANNALRCNKIHFWLGQDLELVADAEPDEFEIIEVEKIPLEKVSALIEKGAFRGAYSLSAFYLASKFVEDFRL